MKVHLVRHAKAEKRAFWDGPDALRPLTPAGVRQARAVARRLARRPLGRLLSSPHLSCRQTLEPLSAARGLAIEVHECLAKGEPAEKAAELLAGIEAAEVVCCSHAELIDDLAPELEEAGMAVTRTSRRGAGVPRDESGERRRLAVIDMGSTSFHMLVADVASSGQLRPVDRERVMLRLGAVLAEHGRIPEDVAARAHKTAKALRRRAEGLGAERLLPVATAALRESDNGAALAKKLGQILGAPVRMLSGEEEARLIFAAFGRRVRLPRDGSTLGLDLGGGSLELAAGDAAGLHLEATLGLGVTRLHHELVHGDPLGTAQAAQIAERVRTALAPLVPRVAALAPRLAVVAGGTARGLARLLVAGHGLRPAQSVNELGVSREDLRALCEELVASQHAERLVMPGMRRRRADLLPTGAVVLASTAETLGLDGYTVTDWGLREGVLLEAVGATRSTAGALPSRSP